MIPALALFRVVSPGLRLRLWLPLFLAWPFVAIVLLLLLPFAVIGWMFDEVELLDGIRLSWRMLAALSGTHVEIGRGSSLFLLRIV